MNDRLLNVDPRIDARRPACGSWVVCANVELLGPGWRWPVKLNLYKPTLASKDALRSRYDRNSAPSWSTRLPSLVPVKTHGKKSFKRCIKVDF